MDIDKTFEELYEGWKLEKEARTYKDRVDDDEKKKKKHFAFGGKKKSRHGESGYGKGEEVDRKFAEEFGLDERKMTDGEKEEREEIVKKLKPKLQSFKDRYGDDAKKVMYATATKQAMEEFKLGEGWKKGKYKVTDGKTGKVLGTFNSGAKAQKYVDDIFQKGDYEALTVELIEEASANKTGVNVVGTGDDPTVWVKKKKRINAKVKWEDFGGTRVYVVPNERWHASRLGKNRYARYEKYIGNDKLGETIRLYGRENPKSPIILKNEENGAMLYLKYGGSKRTW